MRKESRLKQFLASEGKGHFQDIEINLIDFKSFVIHLYWFYVLSKSIEFDFDRDQRNWSFQSYVCIQSSPFPLKRTGCSLNIVFFLKMLWFFWTLPVLLQRWFSTCVCVHPLTPRGKQRKARVRNISKYLEKKTIFDEHPVALGALRYIYLSFIPVIA